MYVQTPISPGILDLISLTYEINHQSKEKSYLWLASELLKRNWVFFELNMSHS